MSRVDTGVRDMLTMLVWSKKDHLLAVGTSKGNVLIYNHSSSRKVPILGKHAKRITTGDWSDTNLLALTGDDHMLTISNSEGDTLYQCQLKGEPSFLTFTTIQPRDTINSSTGNNCVSLILNKKNLFLLRLTDMENPYIMSFQEKYGSVKSYQWFGEGYIIIGFSCGLLVTVSTHQTELGQEISSVRAHQDFLNGIAVSTKSKKVATFSENVIKFFDLNQLEDTKSVLVIEDEKSVEWLEWTDDGQLLAMTTASGAVHVYLTKLTIIGSTFGSRAAYLSSLLEVTVVNVLNETNDENVYDEDSTVTFRVDIEPSLIAVGPYHVVVSINNRAWFYALNESTESTILLKEKEYSSIVKSIVLNGDYSAALFTNGKLHLHLIESETGSGSSYDQREAKIFNDSSTSDSGKISSISLTNDFLIYATDSGFIEFFSLEDWSMVNVYRHQIGVRLISPDLTGLRIILVDTRNQVHLYNAVTDESFILDQPEDFPVSVRSILWESYHPSKHIFSLTDDRNLWLYAYVSDSLKGKSIEYVERIKFPLGQYPLLIHNGVILCQTESGKTSNFILPSHNWVGAMKDIKSGHKTIDILSTTLKLRRYSDAWNICNSLNDLNLWKAFGQHALNDLNIDLARRVYRCIGDAGMVHSLEKLNYIEEKNLIAGNVSLFLNHFDLAQKFFLSSSKPLEALEMRQNLQDWDSALALANRLSPSSIPIISREYASQLEFQGDYRSALDYYEKALTTYENNNDQQITTNQNNKICKAGIARASLRCGNIKKGVEAALELVDDHELHIECGSILESLKLYSEAAQLYEQGGDGEKAAKLYLSVRNTRKVGQLIDKFSLTNVDILNQYGRIKESQGDYKEAVKAYLSSGLTIDSVRLLLDKLNNPSEAVRLVKDSGSLEGAKMIARFFQKINDIESAIEFLILSKCNDEAFQLATSTGNVDIFANFLLDLTDQQQSKNNGPAKEPFASKLVEDFKSLAIYYEQSKNPLMAGKFYCLSGNCRKGVKLLLQSATITGDVGEAIKIAIDFVSINRDDQAIRYLIDYLMGEPDGEPKDFKYLFRLYMALGQFKDAARTAVIIAKEEQSAGNYRNAHDLLFGMCQELRRQKIKVPMEMDLTLMLIHSYLLAKTWIKLDDHLRSAQLLIRVSNNISKFPTHIVPILTTTIIECQRIGFKKQALQFASMLMKPEYRDQIDSKFRRKFETLVRKSASIRRESDETGDSIIGKLTNCPYCDAKLLETELICFDCRNNIPFCIATGHHIIKDDLTVCPSCSFPALKTNFIKLLNREPVCPMCGSTIDIKQLETIKDITKVLNPEHDN
ncbi:WD repeat-containing protein 19-like isoform X2 [Panonychus citri]|nr:WD repeat-containing protein 19-like isoform X2 [Panonychus citri]